MDYPYENLSPEKFQLFCQALLAKEHPGVQCLPVAQPDGGRDATQMFFQHGGNREFGMFQVKFVRQPLAENDAHKWIQDVVAEEAPKVKKQIRAGAKFYILMTNARPSLRPNYGSSPPAFKTSQVRPDVPKMPNRIQRDRRADSEGLPNRCS